MYTYSMIEQFNKNILNIKRTTKTIERKASTNALQHFTAINNEK